MQHITSDFNQLMEALAVWLQQQLRLLQEQKHLLV
jgi:hypothetical protein